MTEKRKQFLKRIGRGTLYTLGTCGAYLVLEGVLKIMPRNPGPALLQGTGTSKAVDKDSDGTPLFIGS